MVRGSYRVFSPGRIGPLTLPNRIVRLATWDPAILFRRRMTREVLDLYRRVAAGGAGLIITGDFSAVPKGLFSGGWGRNGWPTYEDVRIDGFGSIAEVVHHHAPSAGVFAQICGEIPGAGPSEFRSFLHPRPLRPLSTLEVEGLAKCFAAGIEGVKNDGFDGVQLHAAHGGLLSKFLSPFTNHRTDRYGGSVRNRVRLIAEIVSLSRERVGTFPIIIKVNCTDYVEGGIDADSFPSLARELARTGIDGIEVSGGMRECLVREEKELGFRPVPYPESQTRIRKPERQSYFLRYARGLQLPIPIILGGGNRNVERLERIVREDGIDFVGLCRPLLREPDLPNRWSEGRGSADAKCVSCNSCIFHQRIKLQAGDPEVATCLVESDPGRVKTAQAWLRAWVKRTAEEGRTPCAT